MCDQKYIDVILYHTLCNSIFYNNFENEEKKVKIEVKLYEQIDDQEEIVEIAIHDNGTHPHKD